MKNGWPQQNSQQVFIEFLLLYKKRSRLHLLGIQIVVNQTTTPKGIREQYVTKLIITTAIY